MMVLLVMTAPVADTTMSVTVPFMVFSCIFFFNFLYVFFLCVFFVLLHIVSFLRFLFVLIFCLLLSKPCGFWLHVAFFFGKQRIHEGARERCDFLFCFVWMLVCFVCVCLCLFVFVCSFDYCILVFFVFCC